MRSSKWLVFIRPALAGFDRPLTAIINSPKFKTSIRPENGTSYDGTAALNKYSTPTGLDFFWF
jgi:hypothetical protein